MGMFWHDLRETVKRLTQPGSPRPGGLTIVACGLAVAMAAPPALAQQTPAAGSHTPRKTRRVTRPKLVVPESIPEVTMPAPPVPERRAPEQMPPSVPQVSWDGSQLTINTDNSTLADILVAIRTRTGAEIDVPPNASRERIAARLGPGPAREVIATLLSWTDFDYIIQASDTDSLGIQSVLLIPRGKSDAVVASAGMGSYGMSPRRANQRFGTAATRPAETPVQENPPGAETSTETPVAALQPAPAEPQPAATIVPPATPDVPPAQAEAQSKPVDTPLVQADLNTTPTPPELDSSPSSGSPADQRMQTLQSLYQQRKQMIQDARKTPAN
jgi:hypothetical protein